MLASTLIIAIVVTLLSFALPADSYWGALFLDRGSDVYPLTFQNVMWLLFGIGMGDALYRFVYIEDQGRSRRMGLLPEEENRLLFVRDMLRLRERIVEEKVRTGNFLPYLLEQCTLFFEANSSADQTRSLASQLTELELHRLQLRYSLLRYLAWLIPTLGFIGTVFGLAGALTHLGAQPEGGSLSDVLGPVTSDLALAFNTTILALGLSAILVGLTQFAERAEESGVNADTEYCITHLINRLYDEGSQAS
jgi:biopolymer transport protein ExbB/TolQ